MDTSTTEGRLHWMALQLGLFAAGVVLAHQYCAGHTGTEPPVLLGIAYLIHTAASYSHLADGAPTEDDHHA